MRQRPKLHDTLRWLKFELREVHGEKVISVISNHGYEGQFSVNEGDPWRFALQRLIERLDEETVGHHQLGDLWSEGC